MSTLIFEGILGDPKFKQFYEKLQLKTDKKIILKLGIKKACAKAVNKLFKNKEFIDELNGKQKEQKDQNENAEQSVSTFDSIYTKLLFEANKQHKFLIKQDGDKTFTIIKKGDDITIFDNEHNDVTDPKILTKIKNYIKANADEIKSKNARR